VIHVVVEELVDRSEVLLRLADRPVNVPLSRGDEVARPMPAPSRGHPRNARIIPGSRDFH
jgi:error-prone DNA polymerase